MARLVEAELDLLEAEAEVEAAASEQPPSPTHPGAASSCSSPRLPNPKSRDAGTATTPSGLSPVTRLANGAPVVHVVEGPGGEPLEICLHLPNGFPGQMPSGFDSRPPRPTTPGPSPSARASGLLALVIRVAATATGKNDRRQI
jgi:hypothetical protein